MLTLSLAHATLDGDAIPNRYVAFDEDPVAIIAIRSDSGTIQNVAKGPDARSASHISGFTDALWMHVEGIRQVVH
jgi:hypothetical protein